MLLGDLMSRFKTEDEATTVLNELGDNLFISCVDEAASQDNLGRGEFVMKAIRNFAGSASNDDWVWLIGAIGKTDDPARLFLRLTVEWTLKRRAAPQANI